MYLVEKKDDGKQYAMKVVRKDFVLEEDALERIIEEKRMLNENYHPFLVHMEFGFQNKERLFFVVEYIKGGELYDHLRNNERFLEEQTKFYILQICMAIGFLHSKNVVHRDIKTENILMNNDGYLVLNDYGLAKELNN